jgi:hypothetical protein
MRRHRIITRTQRHTSHSHGERGLFLSSTIRRTNEEVSLRTAPPSSPGSPARSQRVIGAKLCDRRSWPALCLLSRIRGRQQGGSAAASLRSRPPASTLQMIVAVGRQFSCIFPAHPRSLASVLNPRPAARRVSASHCVRPVGFGFQKIFVQRTQKDFPNLPKKAPLGTWERGTLASLRARVSRG